MMNLSRITLFSVVVVVFSSCATVFCGSRAKVVFDTNVPVESAVLTIDGKKHQVNAFPYIAKVQRGYSDSQVKVEAVNYDPVHFTIYKQFNPISAINLLDVLGWGIDAATGAMMKPEQKSYEIVLGAPKAEGNETK